MRIVIYLVKRLIYLIPVIFILTVFVFAMVHLLPGNPADIILAGEGGAEDPVVRAALMKEFGLDKPLPVQYGIWLWRALHGHFGKSVYSQEEVFNLILYRVPATLFLAFAAMIVSILVALPAGIISAVKRQKPADYGAMIFCPPGNLPPGVLVWDHVDSGLLFMAALASFDGFRKPLGKLLWIL